MNHIFISPHLDDTILSCSDYIHYIKSKGNTVTIITVFTEFGNGNYISRDSKLSIKNANVKSTNQFKKLRKKEDLIALKKVGAKAVHIDNFIDGGYRTKSSFSSLLEKVLANLGLGNYYLYPIHSSKHLFSGKIRIEDKNIPLQIFKVLKNHITKHDILYFPIGIGNHVDHILVNDTAKYFKNKKLFWLDYPYALLSNNNTDKEAKLQKYNLKFSPNIKLNKRDIINTYSSQSSCRISSTEIKRYQDKIYSLKK